MPKRVSKLIVISEENYEALRKFGGFGDSYNSIISKILSRIDEMPRKESSA